MLFVKIVVCIGLMLVMSMILGKLFENKKEPDHSLQEWIGGFLLLLALFEVVSLPCIFLKASLKTLSCLMLGTIGILCVVSLVWNRQKILDKKREKIVWERPDTIGKVAITLIVFQTLMLGFGIYIDEDDAFYVATATTAVDTNTLYEVDPYTGLLYDTFPARYVLSPLAMFGAVVGKCIKLRPAVFFHTVLPLMLIPMAYGVYALLGRKLFGQDKKKREMFLLFMSLVNLFSATSAYTQGKFLLLRIWQGKAILAGIILPFLLYFALEYFEKNYLTLREWTCLIGVMTAGCFVSSMGIFLCVVMIEVLAFLKCIGSGKCKIFLQTTAACMLNVALALVYLVIR